MPVRLHPVHPALPDRDLRQPGWRTPMTHLTAPAQPLTDGVLTLRLPSPAAGDIDTVRGYIDQDHTASQHVAENAGFTRAGTVTQYVPAPGRPSRTCAMSWSGNQSPRVLL